MGILTRCINLFKADIHGVMDQLEDKGLLLKQYLRDMEEALDRKQEALNHAVLTREACQKESENRKCEIENLDRDITAAIKKERDDIARLLIRKSRSLTGHRDGLLRHIEALDHDIAGLRECLDTRKVQYERVKLEAETFFREKAYKKMASPVSHIQPHGFGAPLDEEVELDLIYRREAINGGNNE